MRNEFTEQYSVVCPYCRTVVVKDRGIHLQVIACTRCHALFSLPIALKLAAARRPD